MQELLQIIGKLGPRELRVVLRLAQRLHEGQRRYGSFDDLNGRDLAVEALEEATDGFAYATVLLEIVRGSLLELELREGNDD